ncbi:MAG: hypothetical protein FWB74_08200 [Defluviitaleaceae bacterium]|nr:hypothetical protein [Defluviitaleaceae bacterium]
MKNNRVRRTDLVMAFVLMPLILLIISDDVWSFIFGIVVAISSLLLALNHFMSKIKLARLKQDGERYEAVVASAPIIPDVSEIPTKGIGIITTVALTIAKAAELVVVSFSGRVVCVYTDCNGKTHSVRSRIHVLKRMDNTPTYGINLTAVVYVERGFPEVYEIELFRQY